MRLKTVAEHRKREELLSFYCATSMICEIPSGAVEDLLGEKIFRKLGEKTAFAATLGIGAGLLCYGFQNMVIAER